MHSAQMISTHPDVDGAMSDRLVKCIDECHACAQACLSCADASLAEEMVQSLRQCIRLNLDCADICEAVGRIASRRTGSDEHLLRDVLEVCAAACDRCAEECERHADKHAHCEICAGACRACAAACREAREDVTPGAARH